MKPTPVLRHYIVKCRSNKGGKYLAPVSVQEVRLTPQGDVYSYEGTGEESKYFGDIREPLETRGDLVKLAAGDRITRTPHVGKEVRRGRNGFTFVQFAVQVPEWKMLTKRTEDPKLSWLMAKCQAAGLRVKIEGASWHAPMSWAHRDDHAAAWKILSPVDDIRDDAKRFQGYEAKTSTLPENMEIETFDDDPDDFRLMFYGPGAPYDSEVYSKRPGQSLDDAAMEICHKFDWIKNPPNA